MEWTEILNVILENGALIGLLTYFIYKDYKSGKEIQELIRSGNEQQNKLIMNLDRTMSLFIQYMKGKGAIL